MLNDLITKLYSRLGSFYLEREINQVAKLVRERILQIPFYRKKLETNGISISEVRSINNIDKLNKFLEKYGKFIYTRPEDLINSNLSSHLSVANPEERIWIQSSSGYTFVEKLSKNDTPEDIIKKIRRKFVAYTKDDVEKVIKKIYVRGLKKLFEDYYKDNKVPTITIFSRMVGMPSGSGLFPLVALSNLFLRWNVPIRILYLGEPYETLVPEFTKVSIDNNTNGIIATPAILYRIATYMKDRDLRYKNLRFVALGGYRVSKKIVELAHEIGAEIVINGYSAQEVMPLGSIASGIVSSLNRKFVSNEGLIVNGNLVFVRVVDKDGYSVSEGEEGEVRVTSPFRGTTLIDYPIGDITKLISYNSTLTHNNLCIKIPVPTISPEIRRKDEENYIKLQEYMIPIKEIFDYLHELYGYDFAISVSDNESSMYILLPDSEKEKNKIFTFTISQIIHPYLIDSGKVNIVEIQREKLRNIVYLHGHHKPHNILKNKHIELS